MTPKQKLSSPFADALMAGLEDALAHARGEEVPGIRITEIPDVKAIRTKLGLSQNEFAAAFHLSPGTVKGWEQGRRKIDTTAVALLRTIEENPEAVRQAQAKYTVKSHGSALQHA